MEINELLQSATPSPLTVWQYQTQIQTAGVTTELYTLSQYSLDIVRN